MPAGTLVTSDTTGNATGDAATSATSADRLRELEVVHATSERLHRLRDPAALAEEVIALLQDVIQHDFAAVYVIEGDRLKTFAVNDRGLGELTKIADRAYLESLDLRVGENVTGWVARHGRSQRIDDVSTDERYLHSQAGIRSELCVPMHSGGAVMGVINLESKEAAAYTETHQRVLETIANQVAIAIENARLLEQARESQRLKMLADIAGDVSHDLGNLLVAASVQCKALRDTNKLSDGALARLQMLQEIIGRATTLSRRLLQAEQATADEAPAALDINDHLRSAKPLLDAICGSDLRVHLDLAKSAVPVVAGAGQIDQVLINLAVNARHATGGRGNLSILSRELAAHHSRLAGQPGVQLEIVDDGCGMAEETLAIAVEPLFTTREGSSGLGLTTVARLVKSMGGEIRLESAPGRGTRVVVFLPRHFDEEPADVGT